MSEIVVGLCGYRCDLCPAYNNNRQEISEGWKRYFEFEIPSEEIGIKWSLSLFYNIT